VEKAVGQHEEGVVVLEDGAGGAPPEAGKDDGGGERDEGDHGGFEGVEGRHRDGDGDKRRAWCFCLEVNCCRPTGFCLYMKAALCSRWG
jgi:hypothetical protein